MRQLFAKIVLAGFVLLSAEAFAQRRPQEFVAPRELTEQEIADARARSKSNVAAYGKGISQETKPFPWLATFLGTASLIIAAPFALRMFKNMTSEGTRNTFGRGAASEGGEDA